MAEFWWHWFSCDDSFTLPASSSKLRTKWLRWSGRSIRRDAYCRAHREVSSDPRSRSHFVILRKVLVLALSALFIWNNGGWSEIPAKSTPGWQISSTPEWQISWVHKFRFIIDIHSIYINFCFLYFFCVKVFSNILSLWVTFSTFEYRRAHAHPKALSQRLI
jgi:hypothetical protein